jgi:hypothetical protein
MTPFDLDRQKPKEGNDKAKAQVGHDRDSEGGTGLRGPNPKPVEPTVAPQDRVPPPKEQADDNTESLRQ